MKVGSRLLVSLLPTVAVVMTAYAVWAVRQREDTIVGQARQETEAYAAALGLALEQAFEDLEVQAVQAIVSHASREPKIYRVAVYGRDGQRIAGSDSTVTATPGFTERLAQILAGAAPTAFYDEVEDDRVFTVLRALRDDAGNIRGGLEVVQPLDFVDAEQARIRQRFLLNTLTLLVALTIMSLLLVHRSVTKPMRTLITAVRALASGRMEHRVPVGSGRSELVELANEFNRMADALDNARRTLIHEAEERLGLERQVRQSEQLAIVGRLAAGVAHEIAAPLNVISGRAEMALKRPTVSPDQERTLRTIVEQIKRISAIIRGLLDLARRREPQFARVDLSHAVDDVLDFLEDELLRAKVDVERATQPGAWVWADRDHLHQVLINVIMNAIQAMDGVTLRQLTVRTVADSGPGRGAVATLEVMDTGPGLSPETIDRMFEPFFTTKPRGTGLGLIVAKNIVDEHGGTIRAHNRTDRTGTCVSVALPVPEASTPDV